MIKKNIILPAILLIGLANTANTFAAISDITTFSTLATVLSQYVVPAKLPDPYSTVNASNQSLADLANNPANYFNTTFTITMPPVTSSTDPNNVDIWSNDASAAGIGMIENGTSALIADNKNADPIGLAIIYTPCNSSTPIKLDQCTDANSSNCMIQNSASFSNCQTKHAAIAYQFTTPAKQILQGNTTYATNSLNITYYSKQ